MTRFEYLFLSAGEGDKIRHEIRAFDFTGPPDQIQWLQETSDGTLELPTEQIEAEFGLHDVYSDGREVIHGFQGDEVEPQNYDGLMQRWRNHFVGIGVQCGPVYVSRVWEE